MSSHFIFPNTVPFRKQRLRQKIPIFFIIYVEYISDIQLYVSIYVNMDHGVSIAHLKNIVCKNSKADYFMRMFEARQLRPEIQVADEFLGSRLIESKVASS